MRTRTSRFLAATAATAVLVAGCGSVSGGSLAHQVNPIDLGGQSYTVGGKGSADHQVLCEMAVAALQSVEAKVDDRCNLGNAQANRDALLRGDIDLYWENTGTAWVSFLKQQPVPGASPQYRALEKRDLAEHKIVWLEPTWFNPTPAFAVPQQRAQQLGLTSLSDLAGYVKSGQPGNLCVERAYQSGRFGLPGLQQAYGFQVPPDRLRVLPGDAIYQAIAEQQQCAFGEVTAGDPRTAQLQLTVLQDDKEFHPPDNAAVAIRQDAYHRAPDIARVFAPIARRLTDRVLAELTRQVAVDGKPAREVAQTWLRQRGFIEGGA
ncbi:MAG TPA: glycine betaine ABC transporter substrate-binding protein [Pseudonocardiaceae bacterium]|nr:glycine betaine ABC transporter substrate-binding protein [Pseudonocardiaceae bacterium]